MSCLYQYVYFPLSEYPPKSSKGIFHLHPVRCILVFLARKRWLMVCNQPKLCKQTTQTPFRILPLIIESFILPACATGAALDSHILSTHAFHAFEVVHLSQPQTFACGILCCSSFFCKTLSRWFDAQDHRSLMLVQKSIFDSGSPRTSGHSYLDDWRNEGHTLLQRVCW